MHCHHIPDFYRQSLADHGITEAGGKALPDWTFVNARKRTRQQKYDVLVVGSVREIRADSVFGDTRGLADDPPGWDPLKASKRFHKRPTTIKESA